MKFLAKTMQAVKDYDSAILAARKEFEEAKKQLFGTYSNSVATEKLGEAREALTAFEMKETAKMKEIAKVDFAEVKDAVVAFVSTAVPEDFPATLAAIQVKGDKITDFEAESYLKKYDGNYTAYSAVLNVLKSNGKATSVHIHTPDSVKEDVERLEKIVMNWIQNRTGVGGFNSDYYSRLLTKENATPLKTLSEGIEAYIAGGFVIKN